MAIGNWTQFPAGCSQEASVIWPRGLSTGLLFMAWQLTPLRINNRSEASMTCALALEVTLLHFHNSLLVTCQPDSVGGNYTKA